MAVSDKIKRRQDGVYGVYNKDLGKNYGLHNSPPFERGSGGSTGQALIYVLVLIAIVGIGIAAGLRFSGGLRKAADAYIAKTELELIGRQLLDQVRLDTLKSLDYLAKHRGTLNTEQWSKFETMYLDQSKFKDLVSLVKTGSPENCDNNSTVPCVGLYTGLNFIDVVRSSGYRSTLQSLSSPPVKYEFSVRCLKNQ